SGESLRLIAKGGKINPKGLSDVAPDAAQLRRKRSADETVARSILQADLGPVTILIIVAHGLYQQVEVHGLGHNQIGKMVEIQPLLNIFGGEGSDQNDRYVRCSVYLEALHQFGAIHVGHAEIGDDYEGVVML